MLNAPRIMLEPLRIITKAPRIYMVKAPRIKVKAPRIMLDSAGTTAYNGESTGIMPKAPPYNAKSTQQNAV